MHLRGKCKPLGKQGDLVVACLTLETKLLYRIGISFTVTSEGKLSFQEKFGKDKIQIIFLCNRTKRDSRSSAF